MNRFYVVPSNIGETAIKITDADDVRHFVRALRISKGEEVFISDGDGGSYIGIVDQITKKHVLLKIREKFAGVKREDRKIKITLACAVPKYAHFEDIVDKATQLEVDEIIPLFTERALVEKSAFAKKRSRLERVMVSAAKQSGALFLPVLKESVFFDGLMATAPQYDLCLLPHLSERMLSLKDAVSGFKGGNILILIGPEGDFSPREIKKALEAGCTGVSLGDSVLRVDTAAISVVSFLRLHFGS